MGETDEDKEGGGGELGVLWWRGRGLTETVTLEQEPEEAERLFRDLQTRS